MQICQADATYKHWCELQANRSLAESVSLSVPSDSDCILQLAPSKRVLWSRSVCVMCVFCAKSLMHCGF